MTSISNSKLFFLIESCLYSILEKNKLKSLNLEPSFEDDKIIYETMKLIKDEIHELEIKQKDLEENRNMSTEILKYREVFLIKLQDYYKKLEELLESGDPNGYELIIELIKEQREYKQKDELVETSSFNSLEFEKSIEKPKIENTQILKTQHQIIKEQEASLNNLYNSISLQKELTIQMESELELHDDLLEEMEVLIDRSQIKLDKSEKRLEGFTKGIKNNSGIFWIIMIFIVLIFLIIIIG
ncbi:hypothetical protein PNEG_00291 [Pneumocystis murina B123]|uniref:t-SNARE coiled-coil homology domain-containing protein n=1 Tax=Pneumocystis murina (strain B123) TaxID=1069680 RepID=M7NVX5_PNEMU|nr:hypothetical protein PNEG_00291 [Pneumocystis murina B123]EMR11261.1 hypothetical protein PNEG_00291 [Pneumocystis murina B123]